MHLILKYKYIQFNSKVYIYSIYLLIIIYIFIFILLCIYYIDGYIGNMVIYKV